MRLASFALALSPALVAFVACSAPQHLTSPGTVGPVERDNVDSESAALARMDTVTRAVWLCFSAERALLRSDAASARQKSVDAIRMLLAEGARNDENPDMSVLYTLAKIADATGDKDEARRAKDRFLDLRTRGRVSDDESWRRKIGPDGSIVEVQEAKSQVSEPKQPDDATKLNEPGGAPSGSTPSGSTPNGGTPKGGSSKPRGTEPSAPTELADAGADAQGSRSLPPDDARDDEKRGGGSGPAHPQGGTSPAGKQNPPGPGKGPRVVSVTYRLDFILHLSLAWTIYLRLDYAGAESEFQKLFDDGSRTLPDDDPLLAEAREGVARAQAGRGDLDGARTNWDWIIAHRARTQGDDHADTRAARDARAALDGASADGSRSAPLPPRKPESRGGGGATRESARDKARRAAEFLRKCEPDRALALQREAVDELGRAPDADAGELDEARRELATILRVLGQTDEARLIEEELYLARLREQAASLQRTR